IVDRHTHVMPNPTGGMTSVVSGFKISTIEVYNTAGSLVMTFKINANIGAIDVTKLPSGTYILRIHTTHGATPQRLVKS
ncbi:MAG: T9SS type A sorting domain-containing protein, partial [Bacteroidales bacterium]|nr:T9SS type A sorting domain-containing protein [Bacteroidales bacterium]